MSSLLGLLHQHFHVTGAGPEEWDALIKRLCPLNVSQILVVVRGVLFKHKWSSIQRGLEGAARAS